MSPRLFSVLSRPRIAAFAALCMGFGLLAGCGGGGGGGVGGGGGGTSTTSGGTGVLGVSVNLFPGTASGPVGISEVLTVKTPSGTVLQSQTVNKPASSSTLPPLINFNGLPNQTLILHGALFSSANGTGTQTGTLDTAFAGGSAQVIQTAIAQTVSTVAVTPSSVSVAKGASTQLYAAAQDSGGHYLLESGATKWTSSATGVATVGAGGLVTGILAGQSTISASLAGGTGSTTVVVTGVTNGTWTIMVYMDADNNLDGDSIANEAQMEQIAKTPTSQTRMVIQWKLSDTPQSQSTDVSEHPFEGTRRYLEVQGGRELVQDLGTGVDMGQAAALQSFVSWAVQNYPAQHYALVMWGHGNGWSFNANNTIQAESRGISYDYDTGNHINVNQIAPAIVPNHLDILAFDACQMQMLEVQDQVAGVANYMVGSENNTPEPGYPYNTAFSQFFTNPSGSVPTLCEGIVNGFINYYNGSTYGSLPLSQSAVDLSKIGALNLSLNSFSQDLLASSGIGAVSSSVRSGLINYAVGDGLYYYDLGAIASGYAASSAPAGVISAAKALASAEAAAVVYSKTDTGGSPPHSLSPNSTGISIDFSPSSAFSGYASDYDQLAIAQQTEWARFLGSSTANP